MNADPIRAAMDWAEKIHEGQRYGTGSYMGHVVSAWHVSTAHFKDPVIQIATILHDTLETKPEAEPELRAGFGDEVADIVFAVTPGPGKNRRERNSYLLPRILALPDPVKAIAVKLCDRKANVVHGYQTQDSRVIMYAKEHPSLSPVIRAALAKAVLADPNTEHTVASVKLLWIELDRLLGWSPEAYARHFAERVPRGDKVQRPQGQPRDREEELRLKLNALLVRLTVRQEENARLRVALTEAGIPLPKLPVMPPDLLPEETR